MPWRVDEIVGLRFANHVLQEQLEWRCFQRYLPLNFVPATVGVLHVAEGVVDLSLLFMS